MNVDTSLNGIPCTILTYSLFLMGVIGLFIGIYAGGIRNESWGIGLGTILCSIGFGISLAFFVRRRAERLMKKDPCESIRIKGFHDFIQEGENEFDSWKITMFGRCGSCGVKLRKTYINGSTEVEKTRN